MLTPDDRARCAAALKDATPEMLRDCAEWARLEALDHRHNPEMAHPFLILAALALAVARLQEETDVTIEKAGAAVYVDVSSKPDWFYDSDTMTTALRTLPAALAALVERDA